MRSVLSTVFLATFVVAGFAQNFCHGQVPSASADPQAYQVQQRMETGVNGHAQAASNSRPVVLNVLLAEMSLTKLRAMGIDWEPPRDCVHGSTAEKPAVELSAADRLFRSVPDLACDWAVVEENSQALGMLDLLQQQRLLRVVTNSTLRTAANQPVRLSFGGETPVPTADGNAVEFKPHGIRIEILPSVNADSTIRLKLNLCLNELNEGRSVSDLRARRIETDVALKPNQVLLMSGLIQQRTVRVPVASQGGEDAAEQSGVKTKDTIERVRTLLIIRPQLAPEMASETSAVR